MSHTKINDLRLQEALEHPLIWTLIAFTDSRSIPCRYFRPEFTKLWSHYSGKLYSAEIDVTENPTITDTLKVIAVPTTLLIYEGLEVGRFEGPYSHEILIERIGKLMTLPR